MLLVSLSKMHNKLLQYKNVYTISDLNKAKYHMLEKQKLLEAIKINYL